MKLSFSSNAKDQSTSVMPKSLTKQKEIIPKNVSSYDVRKAEILLVMQSVVSHISHNSINSFPDLFRLMFPDSNIASSMELGRTKIGYIINHGPAPYFKDKLFKSLVPACLSNAPRFVSCFDESFNKVSNKQQLDVHIIYFDDKEQTVKRCYIGSQFMGTATSEETLKSFREVHGKLDFLHNMLQISMDGPNVNWKMIDLIKEEKREFDSEKPALLNIGSCGFHVLHGAYKTALSTTDWKLDKFLKACYSIFKNRQLDELIISEVMICLIPMMVKILHICF